VALTKACSDLMVAEYREYPARSLDALIELAYEEYQGYFGQLTDLAARIMLGGLTDLELLARISKGISDQLIYDVVRLKMRGLADSCENPWT